MTIRIYSSLALIIILMIIPSVSPFLLSDEISEVDTGSHEFWLFPLSSKTFSLSCQAGDVLNGQFVVTIDGDQYYGDQQKYDLWVGWGAGVDFYVLNQSNFDLLSLGEGFDSIYHANDVTELSWYIEIPQSGEWYIIYDNDSSVYGKQVEAMVSQNSSSVVTLSIIITLLAFSVIIAMVYFAIKRTSKKM